MVYRFQTENEMKCIICKPGETQSGTATLTLERNSSTFVFKNVPAQVCTNCGEAYFDEAVLTELFSQAEQMAHAGTLIDVRQYAPA